MSKVIYKSGNIVAVQAMGGGFNIILIDSEHCYNNYNPYIGDSAEEVESVVRSDKTLSLHAGLITADEFNEGDDTKYDF